jgi:DNA polymerase-3 subunit gamma/tau
MEDFVVSARKYRPATFNTVVGQAHITDTLKNAIKNNHLAQAFLFCGPRGVGKTTCARILAKTINCQNKTENTEACDQCDSCTSFNSGQSLNIYELDAASNNSVDDIRNLVDQVRYAPQYGKYKVYIIDEVHMLSQSAFNAFLKTLEEPPKHAIFILATTEKHKIIPTILSRCQIFDFNRIQINDIANHLAFIAKSENVAAEPEALHIIAQKADGALRDACSIFDQIVSFAGNNVTYKAVIDNLNILDYDYYFKVTDAVLQANISESLLTFNEILNNGFDGHHFIDGLSGHFRNLLVGKDVQTIDLLEVSPNIKEKYKAQSAKCSVPFLIRGLGILNKADTQYKQVKNQRLQVELSLMQLCSLNMQMTEGEKKNDIIEPLNTISTTTSVSKNITNTTTQQQTKPEATTNTSTATTPLKKTVFKTASPSINQHIAPEKKTETNSTDLQNGVSAKYPEEPFNQQQLENVWTNYANNQKAKNKINLYSILTASKPLITDINKIEYATNNKTSQEILNEEKTDLIGFLRQELKNYSLQLNYIIAENNDKKNIYTATDKYKHFLEKNPNINKLRQAFDLDVEF